MKTDAMLAMLMVAGLSGLAAFATSTSWAAEPVRQGFDLRVMNPPAAVAFHDGVRLTYELHITNFSRDALTVTTVEVLDGATGETVVDLHGEQLGMALEHLGRAGDDVNRRAVEPGMRAIVYLSAPADADLRMLRHRLTYDAPDESDSWIVEGGEATRDERAPLVLGPPLRGGPWAAIFHPDWQRGHRRVVYAVNGRARIPGRFAVDWMRALDHASRPSEGLGADVLAVADARVVAARGDFEQPEGEHAAIPLVDANGNYVTLDLGDGRYAFYEHLTKGVRVQVGDRVRKGDVLGALGATGHVTGPHLHFHVADANSPLDADGLPYVLENFRVLGRYDSIDAFRNGQKWQAPSEEEVSGGPAFPSPMMVVEFPGRDEL